MIWWGWSGRVDYCPLPRPRDVRGEAQLGYGVIGNTTDSGSVILGSSPGTPADLMSHVDLLPPSFSGLGHRPLTAAAPVRIRLGVRIGEDPPVQAIHNYIHGPHRLVA